MISPTRLFPIAAAVACAVLASAVPASADPVADFYRGKTITAISGGGADGGFSFNARVLGRHIVRHIPGHPAWAVAAMPGDGGARSMKYVANVAPRDGTVVGAALPPSILAPLLREKAGYDSASLRWIGSITPMAQVISVWHTHGIRSLADARKREVVLGASSELSSGYLIPAFVNALTGTRFKVIAGYSGGDWQNDAMQKGEIEGRTGFYNSYRVTRPRWHERKSIVHLVQLGPFIGDLPDVPRVRDLARTDEERRIVQFLQVGSQVGHGFYASPNVPRARIAALRAAFDATMTDPAFQAEAKRSRLIVDPVRGEDLERAIASAVATPKPIVDRFKEMVKLDTVELQWVKEPEK